MRRKTGFLYRDGQGTGNLGVISSSGPQVARGGFLTGTRSWENQGSPRNHVNAKRTPVALPPSRSEVQLGKMGVQIDETGVQIDEMVVQIVQTRG